MRYGKKGVAAFPGHGRVVLTEDQRRIQELERENAVLRQEREILKKATLFFAKESR
jgi:transposase